MQLFIRKCLDQSSFGLNIVYATLTISNEEKNDIMKIIKSLEESALLVKSVGETFKTEAKEQKGGFIMLV